MIAGAIVTFLTIIISMWCFFKIYQAMSWHNQGVGERKGKAEYSRIQREEPSSSSAKLGESEFVNTFVSSKPGALRYVGMVVATIFIGGAVSVYFLVSTMF